VAIICPSPLTYARQRPITASHSSRYDMLAIISSRYQYGPFLFFVAEVMSSYLTTDGLKKIFSTSGAPPWGLRPMAFATSATWLIRHWLPSWFFPTFVQKRTFRYSRHKFVCYRPFPGHVSSTGLKTLVPEVTSGSWWRKIVDDTCLHFSERVINRRDSLSQEDIDSPSISSFKNRPEKRWTSADGLFQIRLVYKSYPAARLEWHNACWLWIVIFFARCTCTR